MAGYDFDFPAAALAALCPGRVPLALSAQPLHLRGAEDLQMPRSYADLVAAQPR
jgi:hypothetical protein